MFETYIGKIREAMRPPQGCNFSVTLLDAERGRFIVKTGDEAWKIAELAREASVLRGLTDYQPHVPGFVAREDDAFLFTYLDGVNLAVIADGDEADPTLGAFWAAEHGRFLRQIHSWTPDLPRPETDWLDFAVKNSAAQIAAGNASGEADEFSVHAGKTVEELLGFIRAERPRFTTELQFGHGDWCLPNALVSGGRVTGAVDWSNGGYADYRYDVATALWSLRRNNLAAHTDAFLNAYGFAGKPDELPFFEAIYALM
jgi:aminoglycoside phosphotransferase